MYVNVRSFVDNVMPGFSADDLNFFAVPCVAMEDL